MTSGTGPFKRGKKLYIYGEYLFMIKRNRFKNMLLVSVSIAVTVTIRAILFSTVVNNSN